MTKRAGGEGEGGARAGRRYANTSIRVHHKVAGFFRSFPSRVEGDGMGWEGRGCDVMGWEGMGGGGRDGLIRSRISSLYCS